MKYQKTKWIHAFPDDPIWIYEEIDEERLEQRKVEVFPDGSYGLAGGGEETHGTRLAWESIPSMAEIGSNPDFEPIEISREEFEGVWVQAQKAR